MALDEENAVSLSHIVTAGPQRGVACKALDAFVQFIKILISLRFAPLRDLKNGPLRIELFEAAGARPLPAERREPNVDLRTHGNKHVSFVVENVREFAEVLRQRGADIVWVREFEFGANIFIRDNAGNLIEFVQAAPPEEAFATL